MSLDRARLCRTALFLPLLLALGGADLAGGGLRETPLVSDQPQVAKHQDSHLVNAWGLAYLPTSPFWIADNAAGTLTLYVSNGDPFPTMPSPPLVVTVPPPQNGSGPAAPTGLVANTSPGFVVSEGGQSAPALFITVTEDGTISGWSLSVDPANAILEVDNSASHAVYKGVALATRNGASFLYATDFHNGHVDMFDSGFGFVKSFSDPSLPAGFAPFNVAVIDGKLFVTFAKQAPPDATDDQAGPGNGFIDVFELDGTHPRRLVSGGVLNSPWGLAVTPDGFPPFGHALLVGNFGDGRINAFDPKTGFPLGRLRDDSCKPIEIDGLWSLAFGNDFLAGEPDILYFTAGPEDESHGLFGKLKVAPGHCDQGRGRFGSHQ
jgi:uncharacterized protein (TIGR03118 family)